MWKFTREKGLEELHDDTLEFQENEEWDVWLKRIGFTCYNTYGCDDDIRLSLYHDSKRDDYRYMVDWEVCGEMTQIFISGLFDVTEFLKSYLPIVHQSIQILVFQKFLDGVPEFKYDALVNNVREFLKCLR